MSNLESVLAFIGLSVGGFLLRRIPVEVLIQVVQLPGEGGSVLFGRLAGFPQGFLFGIERIVIVAELFNIKVSGVNAEAFQHIFSAVMEQKLGFVLAQVSVLIL